MVQLDGRGRRRIEAARANGYLNANGRDSRRLVQIYGLWCWQLRVPMVWFERRSRWSRFGRLRLDLFTTPDMLTGAALDEIQALLRDSGVSRGATVTAHDVVVDRVPLRDAPALARSLYRAATKPWHTEPNRAKLHTIAAPRRNGNLIQLEAPRAVPA